MSSTWERTVPTGTPKRQWPDCPKCGSARGDHQWCKNGCETWSANPVGTAHGGDRNGVFKTRGGPRGHLAESEE